MFIKSRAVDPNSLNPDGPDPAFQVNPDPDLIRFQGFDEQKRKKKKRQLKFCLFFLNKKLQFTYPLASITDGQATGEACNPQKRTSSISNK
jgi:hypothetical protein